jgi:glycosyltransferase involved in cell wall biosynthesis
MHMDLWQEKGLQVLISYYNAEEYIERAINSVEESMQGHKWILVLGGDGDQPNTYSKIEKLVQNSSSDRVVHKVYPKATNVSTAKNRVIKEGLRYAQEYPSLLVMDADDEMTQERPKLLDTAVEYDTPFVVGAWKYEKKNDFKLINATSAAANLGFTSCCTLLHESLVPKNGRFFYDEIVSYGDVITWHYLKIIKKISPIAHINKEEPVHLHYKVTDSITNPESYKTLQRKRRLFKEFKRSLREGIDIFDNPPNITENNIIV